MEGDEWKTAFLTTRGHYEYQYVIAYIDDILIYSKTEAEHVQHVRTVLSRLLENQLYVKAEKCEFYVPQMTFLGYQWTEEASQAFTSLKERFTPDPNLPFVVEVDASDCGIGAVLSQRHGQPGKLYPCAFFSHKLTSAELITYHKNLEYIKSAKRLNLRQARWALFFTCFQFTVTYRPGSKNSKADALSRRHDPPMSTLTTEPILLPTAILEPISWDLMEEIQQEQQHEPPPPNCHPGKHYVPQSLHQRVLQWVHTSLSSGHPGISRTHQLLQNLFWWPSMAQEVTRYVKSCPTCAQSKTPKELLSVLLQPLAIPQRPWSHLSIDFITDLPPSNNFTTILTIIDRFSKSCCLILLKGLPTAMEKALALYNHVFRFTVSQKISIPPSSQWPGGMPKPRNWLLPAYLLQPGAAQVVRIPALGRICPKLINPLFYRSHPLSVCPGVSTSLVPVVG
ncbi:Transposon Ty3-G Gag-Pol polyprotein [Labeo rohita]|uniref:Gypsy retrotransposon integrase-like protein 1 n=1 Tax=Labeo rohita TaxID=84645 RepID=A0ABQ8L8R0_LABRO|nr:Transposon Ty3-G Gag-Pol polyprotein [Labeo rohita]